MTTKATTGILHLIPTNLSEPFSPSAILPASVIATTCGLNHFIAENAKTARAFLKAIGVTRPIAEINIVELDKHTKASNYTDLLAPLLNGYDVGLVSEAGAPAVADPGALVVAAAHRAGITVRPHVGASSILLALMASGLNGQCFQFHGYLPQDKNDRIKTIQTLERESKQKRATQLFIETPYRNQALMQDLLSALSPASTLSIAIDLTGEHEKIQTKSIADWRRLNVGLEKLPTIFLFLA
jgi:16S rRNA (cytidine1402-2'-O)-methyltransferase